MGQQQGEDLMGVIPIPSRPTAWRRSDGCDSHFFTAADHPHLGRWDFAADIDAAPPIEVVQPTSMFEHRKGRRDTKTMTLPYTDDPGLLRHDESTISLRALRVFLTPGGGTMVKIIEFYNEILGLDEEERISVGLPNSFHWPCLFDTTTSQRTIYQSRASRHQYERPSLSSSTSLLVCYAEALEDIDDDDDLVSVGSLCRSPEALKQNS
ncbi:hypothetical protein B7494_g8491 [Chlorociboria aeruginascens]|nr:hypothetical protein B7494_g8491 [Chlorociboria aeruginascens]